MNQCCNHECTKPATMCTYWPGQGEQQFCQYHGDQALDVAQAMGFELHVEKISS